MEEPRICSKPREDIEALRSADTDLELSALLRGYALSTRYLRRCDTDLGSERVYNRRI